MYSVNMEIYHYIIHFNIVFNNFNNTNNTNVFIYFF